MASSMAPKVLTFLASAAVAAYKCVKAGADNQHVQVASAGTDKIIGILQGSASAAEDSVEVALPGGGGKALLGGTVSFGDLLTSDSAGKLVATTTANDRVIAVAMEDGVVNDVIGVQVAVSNV